MKGAVRQTVRSGQTMNVLSINRAMELRSVKFPGSTQLNIKLGCCGVVALWIPAPYASGIDGTSELRMTTMVKPLLFGLTLGSVGTLLAMQYHLVRTDERFVIVSRSHQPPLRSVYVDIRHWSTAMWENYPELQEAVVKAGRQDLMIEHKAVESHASRDSAVPFHGVSKSGATPIFNATEARKISNSPLTAAPLPAAQAVSPTAQNFSTPHIALGNALPAGSTITTDVAIAESGESSAVSTTEDALQMSMQRPVPSPVEIQQAPAAIASAADALTDSVQETPKRDWVKSLLRNIVPVNEQTPLPSAASSESSPALPAKSPSVVTPAAQTPSVITPSAATPPAEPVPVEESFSFPVSPRRIPVASGREI